MIHRTFHEGNICSVSYLTSSNQSNPMNHPTCMLISCKFSLLSLSTLTCSQQESHQAMWNVLVWTAGEGIQGCKEQVPLQRQTRVPQVYRYLPHLPTQSNPGWNWRFWNLRWMATSSLDILENKTGPWMSMVWSLSDPTSTKSKTGFSHATWSTKAAQGTWHALWRRPCMRFDDLRNLCISLSRWKYKGPNYQNCWTWWACCPTQSTQISKRFAFDMQHGHCAELAHAGLPRWDVAKTCQKHRLVILCEHDENFNFTFGSDLETHVDSCSLLIKAALVTRMHT